AGNESTEVKIKIEDGDWILMEKVLEPDPFYVSQIIAMEQRKNPAEKMPYYRDKFPVSQHLWKARVPSDIGTGVYKIIVRASDDTGLNAESQALLFIK
ncbi:MAG: hypothetical protein KDC80_03590, partial [Saprospiraceae bacterium]|nr:hypothetical protein [Saprospiraceae bacterium]